MAASTSLLIIFLKAPRVGTVKTRLAMTLGADAACAAYRCLVTRLLNQLDGLENVQLRFTPDEAEEEIRLWRRARWTLAPQGPGDLGTRLDTAFREAFAAGWQRVAIIGSDCPYVLRNDVQEAWAALEKNEVVVGPAVDGGYWLIGLRAARPALFQNISWSTPRVLEETLQRSRTAGWSVIRLRELMDIDTAEEWAKFQGP